MKVSWHAKRVSVLRAMTPLVFLTALMLCNNCLAFRFCFQILKCFSMIGYIYVSKFASSVMRNQPAFFAWCPIFLISCPCIHGPCRSSVYWYMRLDLSGEGNCILSLIQIVLVFKLQVVSILTNKWVVS